MELLSLSVILNIPAFLRTEEYILVVNTSFSSTMGRCNLALRDQKMKFYSVDPKDIARRPNLEGGHCYDSTKDKKENPNFDLSHGSFWNNLFFLFGSLIHNPFTLADHFCWGCVASSCVCQCVGWVAHQPRTQKQLSLSLS